jgi:hypothetical protein
MISRFGGRVGAVGWPLGLQILASGLEARAVDSRASLKDFGQLERLIRSHSSLKMVGR